MEKQEIKEILEKQLVLLSERSRISMEFDNVAEITIAILNLVECLQRNF